MTREDRRAHFGGAVRCQCRDSLAIYMKVGVRVPGPSCDVGVVLESGEGLRGDVVLGLQGVVPVPPVKLGVGDEGVQAAAEGERGRNHGYRDDRSGQDPSGRYCRASCSRFEGELDANDPRQRQTDGCGSPRNLGRACGG